MPEQHNETNKRSNTASVARLKVLVDSHDKSIRFHIAFGVAMFLLGVLLFILSYVFMDAESTSQTVAQAGSGFVSVLCAIPVNKINNRRGMKGVLKYLIIYIVEDPKGFADDEHAQEMLKKYLEQTLLNKN